MPFVERAELLSTGRSSSRVESLDGAEVELIMDGGSVAAIEAHRAEKAKQPPEESKDVARKDAAASSEIDREPLMGHLPDPEPVGGLRGRIDEP